MTTISYRIGHAPRLPRRERTVRLLTQLGRYALAWGVVGWACYWVGDVHLFVPGLVIAALVANPWRMRAEALPWRCYRCGRRFVHARLLASHLTDIHNEQPVLSKRPVRPAHAGSGSRAVHSPLRQRAVRAGLLLLRPGRT